MNWLRDRAHSASMFALGALLPLAGLACLTLLGALLATRPLPWTGPLALVPAAFLLGNATYGFHLALKSFSRPPGRRLTPGEAPALQELLASAQAAWRWSSSKCSREDARRNDPTSRHPVSRSTSSPRVR